MTVWRPLRFAVREANRYMLDHADSAIAYAYQPGSNAVKLLQHARRREKQGALHVTQLYRPK